MDYEKKYKEALKRAEKALEVLGTDKCEGARQIFSLFPELKESEDERIRKGLVKAVSGTFEGTKLFGTDVTRDEALAWLEKQGEPTDNDMVEALRTEYEKGRADAFAEMQKEWSEEDKDFMYDTLSNLTELKDRYGEGYGNVGKCIDWLKILKQRIGGKL